MPSASRSSISPGHLLVAALAVIGSLVVGGCGGDDEPADDEASTTEPAAETTTTAPAREQADQVTGDLAAAAVLQIADFGEGWKEYSTVETWTPTEDSCGYRPGGPEDVLATGAVLNGPTVQLDDTQAFVSSRAYVFPTEDDATAWVAIAAEDAWSDCINEGYQEAQDDGGTGVTMSVETRDNEAVGQGGLEAFARYFGRTDDGQVAVDVVQKVYRLGRVVLVTTIESAVPAETADTLADGEFAAATAAYARINALTGATPPGQ